MGRTPSKDEYEDFRKLLRGYLVANEITQADLSRQVAYSSNVISEFLNGSYKGSKEKVARELEKWLSLETSGGKGAASTAFVSTAVASRMLSLIKQTKRDQTVGIIHGPAGVSKTIAARAAAESMSGVTYIQCTSGMRSPSAFARQLAKKLGLKASMNLADNLERIIDHFTGSKQLLIVDEASMLKWDAGLVVRDIHKGSGIGVVLIGTDDIEQRLIDDRGGFSGQWSRLVSYRYDITDECARSGTPLFTTDEVKRFAEHSMGLRLTVDAIDLGTDLANTLGWGGLGSLEALLRTAELVRSKVDKDKRTSISADHLRRAYATTRGRSDLERAEGRIRAEKKRKVA